MTLFGEDKELGGATFSQCGKYRYSLYRIWSSEKPLVAFIGLNPSTANESTDDRTIRRVKGFAKREDFGWFVMLNLFALVSPYPKDLELSADPLGQNDAFLFAEAARCSAVVFCWGAFPQARQRAKKVEEMFPGALCLGKTKEGAPRHPLYLSQTTKLEKYAV